MQVIEKELRLKAPTGKNGIINEIRNQIEDKIDFNEIPVRFVVTKSTELEWHCEIDVLVNANKSQIPSFSIFDFKKRNYENNDTFNVALIVPTGIGADLGGHAGDAGALARLISSCCDNLITHPNVVNASDINELPENGIYLEGSTLSRLLMGTIGIQKVRSNRLLVVIDDHEDSYFTECAINSVSAARATLGLNCVEVIKLANKAKIGTRYTSTGRAVGHIENFNGLYDILSSRRGNYDAVALSTIIVVPLEVHKDYYLYDMVNPWGGAEAMLTHSVSLLFNIPSAHSPMMETKEASNLHFGVVDPRMAAETVSTTFLHCIFKGLHNSPKIITNPQDFNKPGILSISDINCIVIPDKCLGLPILAAIEQDIPIIAVKENRTIMENDLTKLNLNKNQLYIVNNYWEAVGVLMAIKSGISPETTRRPIILQNISENNKNKQLLNMKSETHSEKSWKIHYKLIRS